METPPPRKRRVVKRSLKPPRIVTPYSEILRIKHARRNAVGIWMEHNLSHHPDLFDFTSTPERRAHFQTLQQWWQGAELMVRAAVWNEYRYHRSTSAELWGESEIAEAPLLSPTTMDEMYDVTEPHEYNLPTLLWAWYAKYCPEKCATVAAVLVKHFTDAYPIPYPLFAKLMRTYGVY